MDIDKLFSTYDDVDYSEMTLKDEEYRKSLVTNKAIRQKINEEDIASDTLITSLKEANHLGDNKERYIELARLYLSDMETNMFRNQFQLAREYGISADEWNDFLSDRIVSVYLKKHKRTLLKSAAEDNLADPSARNKRDNLKLIENLQKEEESENNRNIVILRIPDVYDEE